MNHCIAETEVYAQYVTYRRGTSQSPWAWGQRDFWGQLIMMFEDGSDDQIKRKKRAPQATTNSGAHMAGIEGRTSAVVVYFELSANTELVNPGTLLLGKPRVRFLGASRHSFISQNPIHVM